MSVQIFAIRSIALATPLLMFGVGIGVPVNSARADDCLAAPNADAPKGQHWYYHTDRKKGRKCWFLHALLPSHAGAVKKPETAGSDAPLPPFSRQSASTSSTTTRESVRQDQSRSQSAPDTPAPQTSVWPQPGAHAPTAAPVPAITWPDPPMLATATVSKPDSVRSHARPDSVPVAVSARTSHESEGAARAGAPAVDTDEIVAAPAGTLVQTSLVVALGLIVGGVLYRLVRKMSAARGPRIIIDRSEFDWIDNRREQPHEFVNDPEAFVDDARLSLVPAAGDYGVPGPRRADDRPQNNALRKGRAARITEQVIERENTLMQLMRDLDDMLQSRKGA